MILYIHEEYFNGNHSRIKAEVTAVMSKESVVRTEQRCGTHF